jgi:hypothetical protein
MVSRWYSSDEFETVVIHILGQARALPVQCSVDRIIALERVTTGVLVCSEKEEVHPFYSSRVRLYN